VAIDPRGIGVGADPHRTAQRRAPEHGFDTHTVTVQVTRRPRRESLPVKAPAYGAGVTVSVNVPDSALSYPSTMIV